MFTSVRPSNIPTLIIALKCVCITEEKSFLLKAIKVLISKESLSDAGMERLDLLV